MGIQDSRLGGLAVPRGDRAPNIRVRGGDNRNRNTAALKIPALHDMQGRAIASIPNNRLLLSEHDLGELQGIDAVAPHLCFSAFVVEKLCNNDPRHRDVLAPFDSGRY